MDVSGIVIEIVQMVMKVCELIAEMVSALTAGLIPVSAVDEVGILIILLVFRAGFDFTKKILNVLIIIVGLYITLQIVASLTGFTLQ